MLSRAGPTLEAEGLITKDRLRYSVHEDHRPGKPLIISDDSEDKLTRDQYDELIEDFNEAVEERNRRREVVHRLEDNYAQELREYLLGGRSRDRNEFDRQDLLFKMQAAQQFIEAELSAAKLRHQVRRSGRVKWLEPFCDFAFD